MNLNMLIEQAELITIYLLILPPLAFNIICYHFFVAISTNSIDVVSACPKMSTPQYFLNFPMSLENFLSCYDFYRLHNILGAQHWHTLNQKMHMVFINSYFHKMNLVPFSYSYTYFLQCLRNFFCNNFPPVFRWTYNVV